MSVWGERITLKLHQEGFFLFVLFYYKKLFEKTEQTFILGDWKALREIIVSIFCYCKRAF